MRNRMKGRKTKEQVEALIIVVRTVLKQPEKNAQRDPGENGWVCYYCEREGHLKRGCPQASKLTPVPYPVRKGPHWRRDCPHRCKFQGSDSQESSPTPQFKSINSSVLGFLHSPTLTSIHDHRKNHSLD